MAMVKQGSSFDNSVVQVIDGPVLCEKCQNPIDVMKVDDGKVKCDTCGHKNKVKDIKSDV